MQSKAIFFDRDNTLIIDSNYMHKIEDLSFYQDTFTALKNIQDKGHMLFIVTNQSGIGRGYFSEEQMHTFNNHMLSKLNEQGINIKEIVFCPHTPEDECDCRKPSPKLINELIDRYNIDKSKSYMLGDKLSDAEAGLNAGIKGVLLNKKDDRFEDFISLTDFANSL